MKNGTVAAADQFDVHVLGRVADDDSATELANVEALISEGVQALVISPVGASLSADVVSAVEEAGIPMVVVGVDLDASTLDSDALISTVTPYTMQGGWLAGSVLCEAVGAAGAVVELTDNSEKAALRSEGFAKYLAAECSDVTSQVLDVSELEHDAAVNALIDTLSSDDVAGVLAYNDELSLIAADALTLMRGSDVSVVGFDVNDNVLLALQNESLLAVVTPGGWSLGSVAIEIAATYLNGEEISDDVVVHLGILNLDSLTAFRSGGDDFDSNNGDGDFNGGDGSGNFEGGGGSGNFEGGDGSGNFEGGGGSGNFEGGGGSGNFEGGGGSGNFEGGGGSGNFEGGGGSGNFEDTNGGNSF